MGLVSKRESIRVHSTSPAITGGDPVREEVLGYGSQCVGEREREAVVEALEGDYISRGPTVEAFEDAVADFLGVDHAVATTSGTTALHLAGAAAGFESGDEVVTTPLTFVATAHTAIYNGATPVLADVDRRTRTLDPAAIREQLGDDTAGIVPMHYAGHPCAVEELLKLAAERDLTVVWDACHAFGGTWRGEPIGAQPDLATFSFHPVKNITTGEGGMVVTDDDELATRCRRLRSFDMNYDPEGHETEPWYQVAEGVGYNFNVTELQAALGLAQLDRIEAFKARRDEIADRYDEAFASIPGVETPPRPDDADPMYHLYAVEIGPEFGCDREQFVNAMHAENVGVQVHYVPLHYHPLFQDRYGYQRGDFPRSEAIYERVVSLPLFPGMDEDDVDDVVRAVERLHEHYS